MKKNILMITSIVLILSGCSTKKDENTADAVNYLAPVIKELQSSGEEMIPIMDVWWDYGIHYNEAYSDKVYTCNIGKDTFSFDLTAELTNGEQWHWRAAGIFIDEGQDKNYICLQDYNILYEDDIVQDPQLLLIEFSSGQPQEYKIWSYTIEPPDLFGWDVVCYRIKDNIFIAGEKEMAVISLDTEQLRYCNQEYAAIEKCIENRFGEEPYHMFLFRGVLEQDGVMVYSAEIAEAVDMPPIAMIYAAYKENNLVSYIIKDLITDEITE